MLLVYTIEPHKRGHYVLYGEGERTELRKNFLKLHTTLQVLMAWLHHHVALINIF